MVFPNMSEKLTNQPKVQKPLIYIPGNKEDGVRMAINFALKAVNQVYGENRRGFSGGLITGRMLSAYSQIHFVPDDVSGDGLDENNPQRSHSNLIALEKAKKPASESLHFMLLKESGIPEEELEKGLYQTPVVNRPFYYSQSLPQGAKPETFFLDSYFKDLLSDPKKDNFEHYQLSFGTLLDLGLKLIVANIDFAPEPKDIPSNLRGEFVRLFTLLSREIIKTYYKDHIISVEKKKTRFADNKKLPSLKNIDIATFFLEELINKVSDEPKYNPRVVAVGGAVLFILPHQSIFNPELTMGRGMQTDINNYFSRPVIETYFELLCEQYGMKFKPEFIYQNGFLTKAFQESVERGKSVFGNRSFNSSFDLYLRSGIPMEILGKTGSLERYPS